MQNGLFGARKHMYVPWNYIRFDVYNGTAVIRNYETKERVSASLWDMPNNLIFESLVLYLVDNANYRMLMKAAMRLIVPIVAVKVLGLEPLRLMG